MKPSFFSKHPEFSDFLEKFKPVPVVTEHVHTGRYKDLQNIFAIFKDHASSNTLIKNLERKVNLIVSGMLTKELADEIIDHKRRNNTPEELIDTIIEDLQIMLEYKVTQIVLVVSNIYWTKNYNSSVIRKKTFKKMLVKDFKANHVPDEKILRLLKLVFNYI